ncbi:hypothetical protein [Pleionea sp. CnH1-48]|uniref:hypothetical protein n=1 Tax=Pleionea sp. CnH1-48 TaxID=2954494 RepID=UPI002096B519|nr:hypothetical protein [Pleionea sp. CnH1-48]MCO7223142.1 hypothetical protein [Pleionea sp. CnH1-48]
MIKHLSFWLGVFIAAILTIPIAYGVISLVEERAADIASMIFGVVFTILLVLFIALFWGDSIMKKLGLTVKKDMTSILELSSEVIKGVIDKDVDKSLDSTKELSQVVVAWYSWSTLYKWVLQTSIALLLAFAAFAGTVLVFEQIRKIEEQTQQLKLQGDSLSIQNELLSLSMTEEFRKQLDSGARKKAPASFLYDFPECKDTDKEGKKMSLSVSHDKTFFSEPNPSVIASLSNLAANEKITSKVADSMRSLLRDESGKVALGALKTLEESKLAYETEEVVVQNIVAEDVLLNSSLTIVFVNSYVDGFSCDDCVVKFYDSYARNIKARKVMLNTSWLEQEQTLGEELLKIEEAIWSIISMPNHTYLPTLASDGRFIETSFLLMWGEGMTRFSVARAGEQNIVPPTPAECGQFPYPQFCSLSDVFSCQ